MKILQNGLLTTLLLFSLTSLAQVRPYKNQLYSTHQSHDRPAGAPHYFIAIPPESPKATSQDDTTRVIVKLKGAPLAARKSDNGRVSRNEIDLEHREFLDQLKKIERRSGSKRSSTKPSAILWEYKNTFNGFALITTRGIADELKSYKAVYSVVPSKKVRTNDQFSNQVINAPAVWEQLGITGSGVTIGIIDTGIDYNHPDLGGGFGPSFKVISGYDFFNNDNDPIDDQGHGTHVAGIAAGNGTNMKGVAPDSKLVAYKVLGAQGYGYDDMILAAIERSADPDNNPSTNDALDVVNMSLGRYADEAEPFSEAVNNAVAAGVVYVIAAGNSFDFFTVGTPGVAEKAITVGAVDNSKFTAFFSSKGPVERTFALKPDVAAPGVQITSSFLDNAYLSLDGTSMASPHVAGAAALLLEKNPAWDPAQVKSSLMNTASAGMSNSIWEQGAGVIDILSAINPALTISPASISLGRAGFGTGIWDKEVDLKIKNHSGSGSRFTMTVTGDFNGGAFSTNFSETSFQLGPHEVRTIKVTFTVNQGALAQKNLPDCYSGMIQASNGSTTVNSIVSMVNPQMLTMKFTNELPYSFLVVSNDEGNYFKQFNVSEAEQDVFLPMGSFDVLTYYADNSLIIREGINSAKDTVLQEDKTMAKNLITFQPVDKNGNSLISPVNYPTGAALFSSSRKNFVTFYAGFIPSMFVSDNSSYNLDFAFNGPGISEPSYYEVYGSTGYGFNESMVVTNDPSSFAEVMVSNPSLPDDASQDVTYYCKFGLAWFYLTTWNSTPVRIASNPFTLYQSPGKRDVDIQGAIELMPPIHQPGYKWALPYMKFVDDKIVFYNHFNSVIDSTETRNLDYALGKSIIGLNSYVFNYERSFTLYDIPGKGIFRRARGEREDGNVKYQMFSNGTPIKSGYIRNATQPFIPTELSADLPLSLIKLNLEYADYQVGGNFGKITASYEFDLQAWDPNPPTLSGLSLKVNGEETDELQSGDTGVIRFRMIDHCSDNFYCISSGLSEVTLKYKRLEAADWIGLELTLENHNTATLPSDLETGYYSLQIIGRDLVNNSVVTEISPAFLVGQGPAEVPYSTVQLITPKNNSINAGVQPFFKWSKIDGADYTLELSAISDFSAAQTFTLSSPRFETPIPLIADQQYFWRVKANVGGHERNWSPHFTFRASTLYPPGLITPLNNSLNQDSSVRATWSEVPFIFNYTVELSTTPDFSSHVYLDFTNVNSFLFEYLLPEQTYYWKVTAVVGNFLDVYYLPSETWTFSTGDGTVGIEKGENVEEWHATPNPFSTVTSLMGYTRTSEKSTLVITDQLGREVFQTPILLEEGSNNFSWDGKNNYGVLLPNGVYTGVIVTGRQRHTVRLSILR